MTTIKTRIGAYVVVLELAAFVSLAAQTRGQTADQERCSVEIASPRAGENVGATVDIDGKATIPRETSLWIFLHRKGLAIWWPQGGGAASIEPSGAWVVLATVGGDQDRAARFEIIAGVVDKATSARLDKWFLESEKTGNYNGIRLPEFDKRCGAPRMIEVTKTR